MAKMTKEEFANLTIAEKIRAAVKVADELHLGGSAISYLKSTALMHTEGTPGCVGSYFTTEWLTRSDGTIETLEHRLFEDHAGDWVPYTHPSIAPGCIAFKLDLSKWCKNHNGGYGIAARLGIASIDDERFSFDDVSLIDPKHTGYLTPVYKLNELETIGGLTPVDFAVCIIELEENGEWHGPIMATFHPGDPVRPSRIANDTDAEAYTATKEQLKASGIEYIKLEIGSVKQKTPLRGAHHVLFSVAKESVTAEQRKKLEDFMISIDRRNPVNENSEFLLASALWLEDMEAVEKFLSDEGIRADVEWI